MERDFARKFLRFFQVACTFLRSVFTRILIAQIFPLDILFPPRAYQSENVCRSTRCGGPEGETSAQRSFVSLLPFRLLSNPPYSVPPDKDVTRPCRQLLKDRTQRQILLRHKPLPLSRAGIHRIDLLPEPPGLEMIPK